MLLLHSSVKFLQFLNIRQFDLSLVNEYCHCFCYSSPGYRKSVYPLLNPPSSDSAYILKFSVTLTLDDIINCLSIPVTDRTYIVRLLKNWFSRDTLKMRRLLSHSWFSWNYWKDEKTEKNLRENLWRQGNDFSSLIAHFPFVRAICLSGSISKYYMDEKSDIDYFIITTAGRMWVARTLLVLLRKYFCWTRKNISVNYFITEESLYVSTQNIYAAMGNEFHCPYIQLSIVQIASWENNWIKNIIRIFQYAGRNGSFKKKIFPETRSWENIWWQNRRTIG